MPKFKVKRDCSVRIGARIYHFAKGENVLTENYAKSTEPWWSEAVENGDFAEPVKRGGKKKAPDESDEDQAPESGE